MTNIKGGAANRGKLVSDAEFRRMWQDKAAWPLQRIADALGVSEPAVRSRALARGLPARGNAKPTLRKVEGREDEFRSMWSFGVRSSLIAAHFCGGVRWVIRTAKRLGLPPRKRGMVRATATLAEWHDAQIAAAMATDPAANRRAA